MFTSGTILKSFAPIGSISETEKASPQTCFSHFLGVENGARTHDPQNHNLML